MRLGLVAAIALAACPALAQDAPNRRPVKVVAPARLPVGAQGSLALYVSRDWSAPLPDITRAVIVLHGYLRNADVYERSAARAQEAAGEAGRSAIMIVPQFLASVDAGAHGVSADTLRWTTGGWEGGEPAVGPTPTSSFAALDAILERLADRRIFPNLRQVVVAGHSGGAQVVQRYAIAAKGDAALTAASVAVRFVVANPSSYAYFDATRPQPQIAAACPGFDAWKYGMQDRPAYLAAATPASLEQHYVARQVVYLLGTLDTDPDHPALDRTCMGEAEGPTRYVRGHTYIAAMQARDGGTPNHREYDIPGVGHEGGKMFTSPCGLHALFDTPC